MQLELNRRSKVPMYRQLAAELREQIVSGAMAEGYRLPPERELSSRLEVNRTTVLQAYQQLKDEGLIASKVGKGTFVLPAASASRTSHTSNSDFGNAITREISLYSLAVYGYCVSRLLGRNGNIASLLFRRRRTCYLH